MKPDPHIYYVQSELPLAKLESHLDSLQKANTYKQFLPSCINSQNIINEVNAPVIIADPLQSPIIEIIENFFKSNSDYKYHEALHKITLCGTGKLGYHVDLCDHCVATKIIPNTCSHSLCPVCQKRKSDKWIAKRITELLPVPYFQIIFKLPAFLSLLTMLNKKIVFDIFIMSVASAMNKIPNDNQMKIGFIICLQTSGNNLWFHPHIHIAMLGVAITEKGELIHYATKESLPFDKDFLSKQFQDEFLSKLEEAYVNQGAENNNVDIEPNDDPEKLYLENEKQLNWPSELKHLEKDKDAFISWIKECKATGNWEVFIGDATTANDASNILSYICQQVPISDDQIVESDMDTVIFKDKNGEKIELSTEEFIRRLTTHVMPSSYHRIRNCGFLSNGIKDKNLIKIRGILGCTEEPKEFNEEKKCDFCCEGQMRTVAVLLGGETVKVCEKNIKKLKTIPSWLSILAKIKSLRDAQSEILEFIPDWLIKLIQSIDDDL